MCFTWILRTSETLNSVTQAPAQVSSYGQYHGPYINGMVTDHSLGADDMLRMDPKTVREHFDRIGRFRILVIGRSNAGKTTVLQRVCNTTELPEVFNAKGEKVGCLAAQHWKVIDEYSQLDPMVVQGSLEVRFTTLEHDTNKLRMLRGDTMTLRMS